MPTTRTKRTRKRAAENILTPELRAFLLDEPKPEGCNPYLWMDLETGTPNPATRQTTRDFWELYGDWVMAKWILKSPGTRPSCWWRFNAPRWNEYQHIGLPQPRIKLRGSGTPVHEIYPSIIPTLDYGIPHFVYVDPKDPPVIESQAAYLRRCGCLTPEERAMKLKTAPEILCTDDKPTKRRRKK